MSQFCIIVISWDGGEELWEPFAQSFSKYWPDCQLEIFLVTQTTPLKYPSIFSKTLAYGNVTWTERLYRAVEEIDCESVILFCDDFFLNTRVDQHIMNKILSDFSSNIWSCLQLFGSSKVKATVKYIKRDMKSLFIISTAVAIWRSSLLIELTSNTKLSARDFEVVKSREVYSRTDLSIMLTKKSPIKYYHAVLEGYWRIIPLFFCKLNNFPIAFNNYKGPTISHTIFSMLKSILFKIALKLFPGLLREFYSKKIS